MATIDLSTGLMIGLPGRVFDYKVQIHVSQIASVSQAGLLIGGANARVNLSWIRSYISLMQGAVPSDLSSLTVPTSRASDKLIEWSVFEDEFIPSQTTVNPGIVSTIYKASLVNATATWFRLLTCELQTPTMYHQLIGTVGLIGSGCDLEMESNVLVSGQGYRILNLRLQFPSTWTY